MQDTKHTLWRHFEQNTQNTHAYAILPGYYREGESALAFMQDLHFHSVPDLPQTSRFAKIVS